MLKNFFTKKINALILSGVLGASCDQNKLLDLARQQDRNHSQEELSNSEKDEILKWDWTVHYIDFGYPLSVDGHIFHTKDILKLTKKVAFKDPNTYEAGLQMFDYFPKQKMAAFSNSVLVNTPNNIVNTSINNLNGLTYGVSAKDLNKDYLEGKIIDMEAMDFSGIKGCHQEIEFKYKEHEYREVN